MAALQEPLSKPGGRASRVLPRCTRCVWGLPVVGVAGGDKWPSLGSTVSWRTGWESQASGSAAACRHAFREWGRAAVRGLLVLARPLPSLYLRVTG